MLGGIVGDVIGSTREGKNERRVNLDLFPKGSCFTDDSVLMIAIADAILDGEQWAAKLRRYFRQYSYAGYGGNFIDWASGRSPLPYGSYGNGSAMRVAPVGWAYDTLDLTLTKAEGSAGVTHNHPEGIKGAKAVAGAIFLARTTKDKAAIKDFLTKGIGYDVNIDLDALRQTYKFDVSCQGSVPQALAAFLQSDSVEQTIRLAVSIGGDSDTIGCMAGAVAEAFYGGVPQAIGEAAWKLLDPPLQAIVIRFSKKYSIPGIVCGINISRNSKSE